VSDDSRKETDRLLNKLFNHVDGPPEETFIKDGLDIVLVGSLTGGTCSGLVPYFGYMLKNIPQVRAAMNPSNQQVGQLSGTFTLFDSTQAQQPDNAPLARNAFAAMKELEYFHHRFPDNKRTLVHWLPDGAEIPQGEPPYNKVCILTPTSMQGYSLTDAAGKHDHSGLLRMTAMNMFLDVSLGLGDVKQGISTDLREGTSESGDRVGALDGYGQRPRAFFSFGAAAFVHPRFQLARMAACRIAAEELVNQDGAVQENEAQAAVYGLETRLRAEVWPALVKYPEGRYSTIQAEIAAHCEIASQHDAPPVQTLLEGDLLDDFPAHFVNDVPFEARRTARWSPQIRSNADAARKILVEVIRSWSQEDLGALNMVTQERALDMAVKMLDAGIGKLNRGNAQRTGLFLSEKLGDPLNYMRDLENDHFFLWAVRLKKMAVQDQWERLCRQVEAVATADVNGLCAPTMLELLTWAREKVASLHAEALYMVDSAGLCRAALAAEVEKIRRTLGAPPKCIRYVYQPVSGTADPIDAAVEALVRQTPRSSAVLQRLRQKSDLLKQKKDKEIRNAILVATATDAIIAAVLQHAPQPNVVDLLAQDWNAECTSHVSSSTPMMEFIPAYTGRGYRIRPAGDRNLRAVVFGPPNTQSLQTRLSGANNAVGGAWSVQTDLHASPSHVVCYCEEAGFSTTFMQVLPELKKTIGPNDFPWTDSRWCQAGGGGPDLDLGPRTDYIRFVLEQVRDVMRGGVVMANEQQSTLGVEWSFENSQKQRFFTYTMEKTLNQHIFEMPKSVNCDAVTVSVGNPRDYENAASGGKGEYFVKYLKRMLLECLQTTFPQSTEFEDRCRNRKMTLMGERTTKENAAIPANRDQITGEYDKKLQDLGVFQNYCAKLAYNEEYTPDMEARIAAGYGYLKTVGEGSDR
jgi:hypothetical protein